MAFNAELGKSIEEAVKRSGLAHREIGARAGKAFSYGVIGDWIDGTVPREPDSLRVLADIVRVPRSPWLEMAGYGASMEDLMHDQIEYPDLYNAFTEGAGPLGGNIEITSSICGLALSQQGGGKVNVVERLSSDGAEKGPRRCFQYVKRDGDSMGDYPAGSILYIREDERPRPGGEVYLRDEDGSRLAIWQDGMAGAILGWLLFVEGPED